MVLFGSAAVYFHMSFIYLSVYCCRGFLLLFVSFVLSLLLFAFGLGCCAVGAGAITSREKPNHYQRRLCLPPPEETTISILGVSRPFQTHFIVPIGQGF